LWGSQSWLPPAFNRRSTQLRTGDKIAGATKTSTELEKNVETQGAAFQLAFFGHEDSRSVRESRLKGGCRQDCLPHY
jgi:hypothetical protein